MYILSRKAVATEKLVMGSQKLPEDGARGPCGGDVQGRGRSQAGELIWYCQNLSLRPRGTESCVTGASEAPLPPLLFSCHDSSLLNFSEVHRVHEEGLRE